MMGHFDKFYFMIFVCTSIKTTKEGTFIFELVDNIYNDV